MARDNLTREQIVRTAIELLDEEGLDGLNMRSLGKRLDAAATAMYWHVENKDNLVRLATDEVWGEVELPGLDTMGWRTAAETMATGMYAMITRHPWVVQAQAGYLLYGPNTSRHNEHVLGVYEKAGFDEAEADLAAATVFMFVLGNAVGASADIAVERRLAQRGGNAQAQLAQAMSEATDIASRYPRLRSRIERAAATEHNTAPAAGFEFGLATLLDGLCDRIESKTAGVAAQ